jgi:hypothetical protein
LKRAAQLFVIDEWTSASPFVERTWRTTSEPDAYFISVAVPYWELVFTTRQGRTEVTVRGPETKASTAPVPQDAEFFGISFRLGTFMPSLPPAQLVDGARVLPPASSRSFVLNGSSWEIPAAHNADVFVGRLARAGLLARDSLIGAVLQGKPSGLSVRSAERHVSRATGLTRGLIRQMQRAEQAVDLLNRKVPISETAARCGYADQAHLARSLRRFAGQTPIQISERA